MKYLCSMCRWPVLPLLLLAAFLLVRCGRQTHGDPCAAFFSPYPDHYSTTERTPHNAAFLDAMALYRTGEHTKAVEALSAYVGAKGSNPIALLYLANSLLAVGEPFEAELQLDHLERSRLKGTTDENEWYTLLCWVCSGQLDRALPEAKRIAAQGRHTYADQAQALAEALEQ